ncbi:DUF6210 family protein [Teredinibacter sp. KSP-S5-2]|uniref:DUF6210 family protein n=1 Tax=Teredinibacter sp. KSP-S5-2 TaxID=3034506 RepID=UPI0029342667|nr:DUF6210 family protein [Teredinibacter sp. KSP-S5-2]WNO11268.1 DUF6210 family protein [Teredinibacter sp. KSP-S5-2]
MNKKIFLDPDGTNESYIGIIFERQTGVTYSQQCGGTDCVVLEVEGYYIPLGGSKVNFEDGLVGVEELTEVFHRGSHCLCGGEPASESWPTQLPADRLKKLEEILESIPYWSEDELTQSTTREPLKLYYSDKRERKHQIMEAWVPVQTKDGIGYLVWQNCD